MNYLQKHIPILKIKTIESKFVIVCSSIMCICLYFYLSSIPGCKFIGNKMFILIEIILFLLLRSQTMDIPTRMCIWIKNNIYFFIHNQQPGNNAGRSACSTYDVEVAVVAVVVLASPTKLKLLVKCQPRIMMNVTNLLDPRANM